MRSIVSLLCDRKWQSAATLDVAMTTNNNKQSTNYQATVPTTASNKSYNGVITGHCRPEAARHWSLIECMLGSIYA